MRRDGLRIRLDRTRARFGAGETLTEDRVEAVRREFPDVDVAGEDLLVVNPDGSPTESRILADRKLCHLFGWRHRCVEVFLLTENAGRMVLQVRSAGKDVSPGALDLTVGGHVKGGRGAREEFDEAAIQELREELGLSPKDLNGRRLIPVGRPYACRDTEARRDPLNDIHDAEVRQIYHGVLSPGALDRIRLDQNEVAEIKLYGIGDTWSLLHLPNIASGLRFSLPIYLQWLQYREG